MEEEESLREIRKTTHGRQTTPASADALEEYACYLYLKWDLPGVLSLLFSGGKLPLSSTLDWPL